LISVEVANVLSIFFFGKYTVRQYTLAWLGTDRGKSSKIFKTGVEVLKSVGKLQGPKTWTVMPWDIM
jgi:hypothetical protein